MALMGLSLFRALTAVTVMMVGSLGAWALTSVNLVTQPKFLLSTLFMVPQISVLLDEISEEHSCILKNYLAFWKAHQEVLLDGEFRAYDPTAHYSVMTSRKDGTLIAAAYMDTPLEIGANLEKMICFNATAKDRLTVRFTSPSDTYTCCIYNCLGELLSEETREFPEGIYDLPVPDGGRVELFKN